MKFVVPSGITPYVVSLIDMGIAAENVALGEEECVFILECEGIYSAGKSFKTSDFLSLTNYPVYYVKRGGRVTVHNPGQVVVYPVLNLKKRDLNVSTYVHMLEQWIIDVLKNLGISAGRSEKGIGVWVNDAKIGFIGIRIEKGISTHGLCLNVNNNLSPFSQIVPCGITGISITSTEKLLKYQLEINKIKEDFANVFNKIF